LSDTLEALDLAHVLRVMPENVTPLWPQLAALFRPALAMVSTHTDEDVRRAIMAMRAQLWVQMVNDVVVSAATTEFVDYPAGLFVRVWIVGAVPDRKMDIQAFVDLLDRWRRDNKCLGFEWIGRHGWLKHFPDAKVEGLLMRWVPKTTEVIRLVGEVN
jgi:hypothetical protein